MLIQADARLRPYPREQVVVTVTKDAGRMIWGDMTKRLIDRIERGDARRKPPRSRDALGNAASDAPPAASLRGWVDGGSTAFFQASRRARASEPTCRRALDSVLDDAA